jgi:hypothetical protein
LFISYHFLNLSIYIIAYGRDTVGHSLNIFSKYYYFYSEYPPTGGVVKPP